MSSPDVFEELRREVGALRALIQIAIRDIGVSYSAGTDPARVTDTSGRYLLLDSQTALVNGLSALAEQELRGKRK